MKLEMSLGATPFWFSGNKDQLVSSVIASEFRASSALSATDRRVLLPCWSVGSTTGRPERDTGQRGFCKKGHLGLESRSGAGHALSGLAVNSLNTSSRSRSERCSVSTFRPLSTANWNTAARMSSSSRKVMVHVFPLPLSAPSTPGNASNSSLVARPSNSTRFNLCSVAHAAQVLGVIVRNGRALVYDDHAAANGLHLLHDMRAQHHGALLADALLESNRGSPPVDWGLTRWWVRRE